MLCVLSKDGAPDRCKADAREAMFSSTMARCVDSLSPSAKRRTIMMESLQHSPPCCSKPTGSHTGPVYSKGAEAMVVRAYGGARK